MAQKTWLYYDNRRYRFFLLCRKLKTASWLGRLGRLHNIHDSLRTKCLVSFKSTFYTWSFVDTYFFLALPFLEWLFRSVGFCHGFIYLSAKVHPFWASSNSSLFIFKSWPSLLAFPGFFMSFLLWMVPFAHLLTHMPTFQPLYRLFDALLNYYRHLWILNHFLPPPLPIPALIPWVFQ